MRTLTAVLLVVLAVWPMPGIGIAAAQASDPAPAARVALVVGNDAYRVAPRLTAAHDAGLVAGTLAAAGFSVTGARDLDGEGLRRAVGEFLGKAAAAGPQGAAVVYLAGHALQLDGENYFVPVDATLAHDAAVPLDSLRLSDLTRALAALRLQARVLVVDGAYADPSGSGPYGAGLALVDAEPGLLTAFNATPGTTATDQGPNYGVYAQTLNQLMKEGGVPVEEIFAQLRVAVNTATHGAVLPWNTGKVDRSFVFFERAADAPAVGSAQIPFASLQARPLKDFSPEQAYDVALARDTLVVYQDYLTAFPDHPLARRIRIVLAQRRESLFWRDALRVASPASFWTYLRRYPKGPHVADARRRLTRLAAAAMPPADFAPLDFDVPPPAEAENGVFDHPGSLDAPDLASPPSPPVFLLPPLVSERIPAPPAAGLGLLPIPLAVAIPFVRHVMKPGTIAPPQGLKGAHPPPGRPLVKVPGDGGPIPQGALPHPAPPAPKPGAPQAGKPLPLTGGPTLTHSPDERGKPKPQHITIRGPSQPVREQPAAAGTLLLKGTSTPAQPIIIRPPGRKLPLPNGVGAPLVVKPLPHLAPLVPHPQPIPQIPRGNGASERMPAVPVLRPQLHFDPPVPHPQPMQQIQKEIGGPERMPGADHPFGNAAPPSNGAAARIGHPACGRPGEAPCRP